MKRRLVFVNRFFHPDLSATSQILSDLTFHLAERGHDVHVITTRQLYENPQAKLPRKDIARGVHIHRLDSTQFGRSWLPGRMIDDALFCGFAALALLRRLRRGNIAVLKTDPPILPLIGGVARLKGARRINWLQDIHPEAAAIVGVPLMGGPLGRVLAWLRNKAVRRADKNVVIGDDMAVRMRGFGVAPEKIAVVHNWCEDEILMPIESGDGNLRSAWGLDGKFVVAYSGNLGRGHEGDTIIDAAKILRGDPNVAFLFIGGGHASKALKQRVAAEGLVNFVFQPYQPRDQLRHSLSVGDIHWLSLRPGLEGLMTPSKFYGIAAAGRPIVAVAAPGNELGALVVRHDCGFSVAPGDAKGLAAAISALSRDPARRIAMGRNARAMLDAQFTKRHAMAAWDRVLDQLP